MSFDVSDLLENLFGGPAAAPPVMLPDAAPPVYEMEPIGSTEQQAEPVDSTPSNTAMEAARLQPFLWWVRRPDSRGRLGWQSPDLPAFTAWEDLPEPGAGCPVCGSLEIWQDLLGRERCGHCEGEILGKALKLAEAAGRKRQKSQKRKMPPQDCARGVAAVSVDTQDLGSNRPLQGPLQGFAGV